MSDDKKLFADVKSPRATASIRTRLPPTSDIKELHARLRADARFNPPTPSVWTRLALITLVVTLLWLAVSMRAAMARTPESLQQQWYVYVSEFRVLLGTRPDRLA
jgi:hypothetical protein